MILSSSRFLLLPALSMILAGVSDAQLDGVNESWVARYNGPANGEDEATAMVLDTAGNIYVTGHSIGSGTSLDFATVKYSPAGGQQWVARYNSPGNGDDRALAIAVDGAGNVYVTGYSTGGGSGDDYVTIKYNSSGAQQWVAVYNGPGNGSDRAAALAVDTAGNSFVTGFSWGGAATGTDYATIMYSPTGAQQWVTRYGCVGNYPDTASAIALDAAGNVYVTGMSRWYSYSGMPPSTGDYATISYSPAGEQQWVARYMGTGIGEDNAHDIALDAGGTVHVTGEGFCLEGGWSTFDYVSIAYDDSGDTQWLAIYDGTGDLGVDRAFALAVDAAGSVRVTGTSYGAAWSQDYATIRYNAAGSQQWAARYDGTGSGADEALDMALDAAGNAYVTGRSLGIGTSNDYATLMYDPAGAVQWVARYDGPEHAEDCAVAVAAGIPGVAYVTGYSPGSGTGADYTTIRYVQTTGIGEEEGVPFGLEVSSNPAFSSVLISLELPVPSHCSIRVYSIDGRLVETLHDGETPSGESSFDWSAASSPEGVYFVLARAGNHEDRARVVLVR